MDLLMKEKINKAILATNGRKTESVGVLMVAFQILTILAPDLLSSEAERAITIGISSGIMPTLLHKLYRNRKLAVTFVQKNINRFKLWKKEKDF